MKFEEIIEPLREGKCCFRDSKSFINRWAFVYKAIPNEIFKENIDYTKNIPFDAKELLKALDAKKGVKYCDQLHAVQHNGRIDNWVPTVSDIFAEDWQIIDLKKNPKELKLKELKEKNFVNCTRKDIEEMLNELIDFCYTKA